MIQQKSNLSSPQSLAPDLVVRISKLSALIFETYFRFMSSPISHGGEEGCGGVVQRP